MRNDHSVEGAIGGVVLALFIILPWVSFDSVKPVNVTINDSGCVKPTTIEIKPAVYNAWPNNNGVM
jgi:hypothetical protein